MKTIRTHIVSTLAAALLVFGAAFTANANDQTVTVTLDTISSTPDNTAYFTRGSAQGDIAWSASRYFTQVFRPDADFILDKFAIQIRGDFSSGSVLAGNAQNVVLSGLKITVSLVAFSEDLLSATTSSDIGGSLISAFKDGWTATGTLPDNLPTETAGSYFTFDLPNTTLKAGTIYGLTLHMETQTGNWTQTVPLSWVNGTIANTSTNNNIWSAVVIKSDDTWSKQGFNSCVYIIAAPAAPIPEPATCALIFALICGPLLFWRSLARRK
ncbi:MAG: hypothetical protein LBK99_04695 [Opitutaceae bacterium]|jgi:hypothetical protein|nr:hypothetical protein [Opitutaceae bacterium]